MSFKLNLIPSRMVLIKCSLFVVLPLFASCSGIKSLSTNLEEGLSTGPLNVQNPDSQINPQCITAHAPAPAGTSEQIQLEKEIAQATNEYRAKKNLSPLTLDGIMSTFARGHAKNMGDGVLTLGHDYFYDRLGAISCSGVYGTSNGAAENAAMGGGSASGFVNMWANSPGHAQNMSGFYTLIGVGYYNGYAVQIFK